MKLPSIGPGHVDRVLAVCAVLAAWQGCAMVWGAHWVSPPLATGLRLTELVWSGELARHTAFTLVAAAGGFVLGGMPGALIPLALRRAVRLVAILDPYLVAGYATPKLALAPLFVLWFGIGLTPKIVLVASLVFFVALFSTAAGVRAVDPKLVAMARVAGAAERSVARHVVWPSARAYTFAGLRIAIPYAIGAAVVGEMVSSSRGLGYLIAASAPVYDSATAFAALTMLALIVLGLTALVDLVERRLQRGRRADVRPAERRVAIA